MYKYHNQLLPSVFNSFFTKVDQVHSYLRGMLLNCLIIFLRYEQTMENSIFVFKALGYGTL